MPQWTATRRTIAGFATSLGRKYGTAARMALSYDMTFAALLLTALYDPPTTDFAGAVRAASAAHPAAGP